MKVLLLNGSSRKNGCTYTALKEIEAELERHGVECEIFQIGTEAIADCIGCGGCKSKGKCVFDGVVNEFIEKAAMADGFVFGSPVYFAHPNGRVQCLLDRAFSAGRRNFIKKPAACVTVARRAGTTASLDVLNKYPTIAEMPLVSSTYWNMVHGANPQDVAMDEEGLQTMRNLAANLFWIMSCIEVGKEHGVLPPETSAAIRTNFVR